jgi:hypothetical protein
MPGAFFGRYRLKAIDGTVLNTPDTPANAAVFGAVATNRDQGLSAGALIARKGYQASAHQLNGNKPLLSSSAELVLSKKTSRQRSCWQGRQPYPVKQHDTILLIKDERKL